MFEISSLLEKPVLSRENSCIIGIIKNVYFSKKCSQIEYFIINSYENDTPILLPVSNATSIGDAVIVQSKAALLEYADVDVSILSCDVIGMPVYTQNGILKGHISKVEATKLGRVAKLFTDTEQYSPSAIENVGDVVMLKNSAKYPKAKALRIPKPKQNAPVFILDNVDTSPNTAKSESTHPDLQASEPFAVQNASSLTSNGVLLQSAPMAIAISPDAPMFTKDAFEAIVGKGAPVDDDLHTPTRIISDYAFLIGRTLSSDLTTYGGLTIAKEGEPITDEVVEKARRAGKLVDLTLLSTP